MERELPTVVAANAKMGAYSRMDVDDVVIIKDDNLPRNQWQLARVVQTYPSDDGLVRKMKLIVADSSLDRRGSRTRPPAFLDRPVQKLVLLMRSSKG